MKYFSINLLAKQNKNTYFKGKNSPIRCSVLENKNIKYLGCNMSLRCDTNIEGKVNKFTRIFGTIQKSFSIKTKKMIQKCKYIR